MNEEDEGVRIGDDEVRSVSNAGRLLAKYEGVATVTILAARRPEILTGRKAADLLTDAFVHSKNGKPNVGSKGSSSRHGTQRDRADHRIRA